MNKGELIARFSAEHKITEYRGEKMVNSLLAIIEEELVNGEKVVIPNFGIFETRLRKARVGSNLIKGGRVAIPEKMVPRFRPGKRLKEIIAESKD